MLPPISSVLLLLLAATRGGASSSDTQQPPVRSGAQGASETAADHRQHRLQHELANARELSTTNPGESLIAVEAVLGEEPTLGQGHYQRGLILWKLGRNLEAVAALNKAIELEPRNAEFLDERGVAAGMTGDDIRAEEFFRKAVAADPDFVRSRSNLAFALMQLHRTIEARAELKVALRLDPTNRLCTDRLRQVDAELNTQQADETDVDSQAFESPWLQVRRQAHLERQRQRHQRASPPPLPPPPFHPRHDRHSDLSTALGQLSLGDIENLGAMFFLMRSAESYNRANKEVLQRNFDLTAITDSTIATRKPYVTGLAVDMIGYQLTASERSGLAAPAKDPHGRREEGLSVSSVEQIVSRLDRWGLAVLPSTIPEDLCRAAEQSILRSLAAPDYGFSAIYNTDHRYDYPLKIGVAFDGSPEQRVLRSLSTLLQPALTQVRNDDSFQFSLMGYDSDQVSSRARAKRLTVGFREQALGPDPTLVEFACVASFPGAPAQNPHSDVGMQMEMDALERAPLVSVFVYLEDVAENMAPLEVWLGTHKFHQFQHGDIMHHRTPPVRLAVSAGSIAIMDSRTLHRGAANSASTPRLALYFSYMGSPAMGPEPLGSTFTMRSEYEDPALTLEAVIAGHGPKPTVAQSKSDQGIGDIGGGQSATTEQDSTDVHQRRGRWCFGNLNSVAGRVHAHYLFLACTPFMYPVGSGQEYHVDAVYDHERRYIGIWVDGVRVALESRFLDVEDGPTSLRRVCHPQKGSFQGRVHHPSDYRGDVAEVWVGEPPPAAVGQSGELPQPGSSLVSGETWMHVHNASNVTTNGKWIGLVKGDRHTVRKRHFPATLALKERSVRISARLRPSSKNNGRFHAAVTIGGDGSFGHRRWQVDCIGTPLVLAWSTRRLEPHDKNKDGAGGGPGSAEEAAKDAKKYMGHTTAEQTGRDDF